MRQLTEILSFKSGLRVLLAACTLTSSFLSGTASAAYLKYDYTATIDQATTITNGAGSVTFNAGDTLSGEFRVNQNSPTNLTWFNERLIYDDALTGFSVRNLNVVGKGPPMSS